MTYYLVAQRLNPLPAMRETWVQSLGPGGRSPGEGNDNPLQYSCLENPMDRGAWWAAVHGVAESDMTEGLTTPLAFCSPWLCAGVPSAHQPRVRS